MSLTSVFVRPRSRPRKPKADYEAEDDDDSRNEKKILVFDPQNGVAKGCVFDILKDR